MLKFLILAAVFAVAHGGAAGTGFKKLFADCPPIYITFETTSLCAKIDGAFHFRTPAAPGSSQTIHSFIQQSRIATCELEICGDGQKISGSYCGKGPCNAFGKNCDGGCIEGSSAAAKVRFQNRWPVGTVFNVS